MAIGKLMTAVRAAKTIKSMLPDSFFEDMKKYVETQVQSVIGKSPFTPSLYSISEDQGMRHQ